MTLNEYQKLAARTIKSDWGHHEITTHALFGLPSEIGEIEGLFQKAMQGHKLKQDVLQKEIGDALWFIAELCTAFGWNLGDIAQMNIDKLRKRYPDGFSEDRSVHREEGDV